MKKLQLNNIWRCLIFTFFLITTLQSFAQNVQVTGKVTDEKGEPLPGVSVTEKGTTNGVPTNVDGTFLIRVASTNSILNLTYIGYDPLEVPVRDSKNLNITLRTSMATNLNEVVVIGFGTAKKVDLTGAVSSVNLEPLRNQPNTNIGQFLQGTVPGLNVGGTNSAGATPSIQIRGRVSINGNQSPLIILDGIQYDQSLSSINPDDVATIDVLKDASSTAVYGAQAANGVILITTRRGKSGSRPRINFSSDYSISEPTVNLRPRNRDQFLQGIRDGNWGRYVNGVLQSGAYLAPDFTTPNPAFDLAAAVDVSQRLPNSTELRPNDYDWWKEGTRKGIVANTNLSLSGGNETITYLVSGAYTKQRGIIINDEFERKSIRANLEIKALPFWKVGMQSSGAFTKLDGQEPSFTSLFNMSPLLTPYDANGNIIISPTNTLELNPFLSYLVDDRDRNQYFFANFFSDIDIPFIKGLNYRVNYGNNYTTAQRYNSSIYGANQIGEAYKTNSSAYQWSLDNILTYSKKFGKHDIQTTLLYGALERDWEETQARATGFSNLILGYDNLAAGTNQFATSRIYDNSNLNRQPAQLNYQMARVLYKFDDKYIITATVRRDGYSAFSRNYKYAIFPSIGLGWVVSSENFWKPLANVVEFMKFRASFGESGNQTAPYTSVARVGSGAAYVFGDGGTSQIGQSISTLGNPDLKWERTRELNLGLNFTMFNSRISGDIDYYLKNTTDLLYDINIPQISGFSNIRTNVGRLQNWGFEASLTGRVVESKDFRYSTTVNFSLNRNKIVSLLGIDANGDGIEDDLVNSGLFIGKPLSQIFDYQRNGIYNLTEPRLPGFQIGTLKAIDRDGNGVINANDRMFLGMTDPRFRISMLNNVSYKGFTLTVLLNSIWGGKDSYQGNNLVEYFREDNTLRRNDFANIDYWSPANPGGKYPRNITGTQSSVRPPYYEDRSFIRIQDVSLGYNFAGGMLKKIKANSLSVYVSGKNLHTFTNWQGWDPEVGTNNLGTGMVAGGRPVFRTFTFGLNINY